MLGKTEGGRRGGRQRMRWLEGTTDSKGMLLLLLLSRVSRVRLCATPFSTVIPGLPWDFVREDCLCGFS